MAMAIIKHRHLRQSHIIFAQLERIMQTLFAKKEYDHRDSQKEGGIMKAVLIALLLALVFLPLLANPVWENPVKLRSSVDIDWLDSTTSYSDGSTIFVWSDVRSGNRDIYAMRVLANGENAWANPLAITTSAGDQDQPQILKISDNDAIISYYDFSTDYRGVIKAQRITLSGTILWTNQAAIVCDYPSTKANVKMYHFNGSVYFIWDDFRSFSVDIYGQRLSVNGLNQWTNNGRQLSFMPYNEYSKAFHGVSGTGFIIVYQGFINTQYAVLAQNYNLEGVLQSPVPTMVMGGNDSAKYLASQMSNELCILLSSSNPASQVRLLRFDSTLQSLGQPIAMSLPADELYFEAGFVPAADGNKYVWWSKNSFANNEYSLMLSKLNPANEIILPALQIQSYTTSPRTYRLLSDNNSGLIIAWDQEYPEQNTGQIGMFRLDGNQNMLWQAENISSSNSRLRSLQNLGSSFRVVWSSAENRFKGIKIQDISPSGTEQHANGGISVQNEISGALLWGTLKTFTAAENKIIIWAERNIGMKNSIYYQCINNEGVPLLEANGRFLAHCGSSFDAIQTPDGDVAIIWNDTNEMGIRSIRTQMINPIGETCWGSEALTLVTDSNMGEQYNISYYDGAIICGWTGGAENRNVYAQKIVSGNLTWGNGIMISTGLPNEDYSLFAIKGPYYVYSKSHRDQYDQILCVSRINSDGSFAWNQHYTTVANPLNSIITLQSYLNAALQEESLILLFNTLNESFEFVPQMQLISDSGMLLAGEFGTSVFNASNHIINGAQLKTTGNDIAIAGAFDASLFLHRFSDACEPLWQSPLMISNELVSYLGENLGRLQDGRYILGYRARASENSSMMYYTVVNPSAFVSIPATPVPNTTYDACFNFGLWTTENTAFMAWDSYQNRKYFDWQDYCNDFRGLYIQRYDFVPLSNPDPSVPLIPFSLSQNYPNPFNPSTTISFEIKESMPLSLGIYNTRGQLIRTLHNAHTAAGKHSLVWDGKDDQDQNVGSGVYFFKLRGGKFSSSKKMVLMK